MILLLYCYCEAMDSKMLMDNDNDLAVGSYHIKGNVSELLCKTTSLGNRARQKIRT